jgi:hypothetical protein
MIQTQDRSEWFGASDTARIMGNWDTKTFARFWLEKRGIIRNTFASPAMMAGTHYEHRILDYLGIRQRDRQIRIRRCRLRVNLDGETDIIHEVKTHKGPFKVTKPYWMQAQVEMFAAGKPLQIVSYRLEDYDYRNYYNPIDPKRLDFHPVEYDPDWIHNMYLPRLKHLAWCLRHDKIPRMEEVRYG